MLSDVALQHEVVVGASLMFGYLHGTSTGEEGCGPAGSPPLRVGAVDVLYIRVDFEDRSGDPVSLSQAEVAMAVASDLLAASSSGTLWFDTVHVTDTYRMPHTIAQYAELSNGHCELLNDAKAAAIESGYDPDAYWSFAIAFAPIPNWSWAGLGFVAGPGIWLNGHGDRGSTIAHEFGHNLGAAHSAWWRVDDGDPLSPDGQFVEYGDVFDVMGNSWQRFPDNQFNTYWKTQFGWLEQQTHVVTPDGSEIVRVYAHDFSPDGYLDDRTYAVRVPTGNKTDYWLEYRQSRYAAPDESGVQIRLSPLWPEWLGYQAAERDVDTLLLGVGGGARALDAPLRVGEIFVDSRSGLSVMPVQTGIASDGNWWIDLDFTGRPWQNPENRFDVNADGYVTPEDVLILINEINRNAARLLPVPPVSPDVPPNYWDVNGDGKICPMDVLDIINYLNWQSRVDGGADAFGEAEGPEEQSLHQLRPTAATALLPGEPASHGSWVAQWNPSSEVARETARSTPFPGVTRPTTEAERCLTDRVPPRTHQRAGRLLSSSASVLLSAKLDEELLADIAPQIDLVWKAWLE